MRRAGVERLHALLDDVARHADVRDAAQAVARHLAHHDEPDAAAQAREHARARLRLIARAHPLPGLARHGGRASVEQVVHVGGALAVVAEDERAHLRERVQPVADGRRAVVPGTLWLPSSRSTCRRYSWCTSCARCATAPEASSRARYHPDPRAGRGNSEQRKQDLTCVTGKRDWEDRSDVSCPAYAFRCRIRERSGED